MAIDPYKSGVLFPEHHDRLVANIATYAKDAGIQPRWIWTKMSEVCGPDELDYARRFPYFRAEGKTQGLCYFRKTKEADPETRMAALAGCLVRNFCRARVMPLGSLLDHLAKDGGVVATALLIPNFALTKAEGGHLAPWQSTVICDLLIERASAGVQTIVYATNPKAIGDMYGLAAQRTIEAHFIKIAI